MGFTKPAFLSFENMEKRSVGRLVQSVVFKMIAVGAFVFSQTSPALALEPPFYWYTAPKVITTAAAEACFTAAYNKRIAGSSITLDFYRKLVFQESRQSIAQCAAHPDVIQHGFTDANHVGYGCTQIDSGYDFQGLPAALRMTKQEFVNKVMSDACFAFDAGAMVMQGKIGKCGPNATVEQLLCAYNTGSCYTSCKYSNEIFARDGLTPSDNVQPAKTESWSSVFKPSNTAKCVSLPSKKSIAVGALGAMSGATESGDINKDIASNMVRGVQSATAAAVGDAVRSQKPSLKTEHCIVQIEDLFSNKNESLAPTMANAVRSYTTGSPNNFSNCPVSDAKNASCKAALPSASEIVHPSSALCETGVSYQIIETKKETPSVLGKITAYFSTSLGSSPVSKYSDYTNYTYTYQGK